MKTVLIVLLLVILIIIIALFLLGKRSAAESEAGLLDNQLTRCPQTPNCVCSEYQDDTAHYIEPLGNLDGIDMEFVIKTIKGLGGNIQKQTDSYVAATFVSRIFGFVDDVELRLDAEKGVLHIRSASRVGHGDLGVNQKRVEKIRQLLHTPE